MSAPRGLKNYKEYLEHSLSTGFGAVAQAPNSQLEANFAAFPATTLRVWRTSYIVH